MKRLLISSAYIASIVLVITILFLYLLLFSRARTFENHIEGFTIILIILFMCIAYSTYLGENSDLARYNVLLKSLQGRNLIYAFNHGWYSDNMFSTVLFWVVAQTGNFKLLPLISTAIIMSNIAFVVNKQLKHYSGKGYDVALYYICLFSIATFAAIMTGVRQNLMLSIFAIAVHRDVVRNKKDLTTVFLYFLCYSIHPASFALLLVRALTLLKGKARYLVLVWPVFLKLTSESLVDIPVLGKAVNRLFQYQDIDYSDYNLLYARAAFLVLVIIYFRIAKVNNQSDVRYIEFFEMLIIFTLGSIPVSHLFSRMITAISYLSLPIFIMARKQLLPTPVKWRLLLLAFSIVTIGLLTYQLVFIRVYWRFV